VSTTETTLTGRVVRPYDSDYAAASAGWNLLFSHRPAVVVFAQETQDVVNALAWARHTAFPFGRAAAGTLWRVGTPWTTESSSTSAI
jgi:FAD/FMN-containing dehydrogenase